MRHQIITEIIIDAPAAKVWNILTDLDRYPDWNPFIIQAIGRLVPGTRLTNTLRNGEKNFVFKPTVLKVEPGHYFDWIGRLFLPGIFDGHHFFRIDPVNDRQVKLIQGEYFSGLLSGMLLRKIGEETRNNFVRMNQAVKQRAEA